MQIASVPLIIGRVAVSVGLALFLAWLIKDARGRTWRRPWLATSIIALLGAFTFMSTFRLAVMRWSWLQNIDGMIFLFVGGLSLVIGVGVWVPTLRKVLSRKAGDS